MNRTPQHQKGVTDVQMRQADYYDQHNTLPFSVPFLWGGFQLRDRMWNGLWLLREEKEQRQANYKEVK